MFVLLFAICYLTIVQSSYQSHHDIQLQSVPDVESYGKLVYHQPSLQDLGEHVKYHHNPEVIKIVKILKSHIPKLYPVHVHHKVPYPIAVKIPHIIKVPHLVKISEPVPVEVIKHVPIHHESEHNQAISGSSDGSFSAYDGQTYGHSQSLDASHYGGQDTYNSQQAVHGTDSQTSYNAPSSDSVPYDSHIQSYYADNSAPFVPSSYPHNLHPIPESNSVDSYQSHNQDVNQDSHHEDHVAEASTHLKTAQERIADSSSEIAEPTNKFKDSEKSFSDSEK